MLGSWLRRRARKETSRGNLNLTGRLVTVADPDSRAAEAYRILRTNLLYAVIDEPPRVIVVSSPGMAEGKSTTCANLATVLAQAEKSVLLVDCDLRKPTLHRIFGLRNLRGAVDVLTGENILQEVWQNTPVANLKLLSVGSVPPNPAELLDSRRFADLLDQANREFDYVIMDAPAIQIVSDATILATQADGTLLVVDAQHTPKEELRQSLRELNTVGATVLGTVMNNASSSMNPLSKYTGR